MASVVAVNPFKVGQKVTVLSYDSAIGLSHRQEIVVKSVLPEPIEKEPGTVTYGSYSERGKRKEFYLRGEYDRHIFLAGHNLPIRVETEACDSFVGACRITCMGEPDAIRTCIRDEAIIQPHPAVLRRVIYRLTPESEIDTTLQVFPEHGDE